ncbi:heparin lyase I family protein [Arthrobacter sp. MPF02]|uniref:heparin lyase I family protein n=1 Tax=Arthrobacter sp. MPF02 TaxID=3388492 RepID=UPI0039851F28
MTQDYQWVPPGQIVYDKLADPGQAIPAGFVRQTAWGQPAVAPETRPPDLHAVYAAPVKDWKPVVWRWADTPRRNSIQRIITGGNFPAYRFELAQGDKTSEGTVGDAPRAEFFSVDPSEKRRERVAPAGFLSDGDEYWVTFAVLIPASPNEFPLNQKWATLFQRKLDDRFLLSKKAGQPNLKTTNFCSWLSIAVQGTRVAASIPGYPAWPGQPGGAVDDLEICTLGDIVGQWVQFVVHEKLSSRGRGTAEVELRINRRPPKLVRLVPTLNRRTFPASIPEGDVKAHFQYGYYRTNEPLAAGSAPPGAGVVFHTPLMIKRPTSRWWWTDRWSRSVGTVPSLP